MKKIIVVVGFCSLVSITKAQLATVDANAAVQNGFDMQQIAIALDQLYAAKEEIEQAKKQWETAKSTLKQAKKTADLLQAVADDKVDFEVISDLGFNNMEDFLMKALCIDPKDYAPSNSAYIKIIASFKSGIGECSNYNNYINTYSGMHYKLAEGFYGDAQGRGGNYNVLISDMREAENQASAMAIVNDRTKLEMGYKYLDMSEDISKKAEELSKALDSDELKISKAERLNLKLSCVEFQLKSMDYKLKGMDLIATASQYSEEQKRKLEKQKNALVWRRMLGMSH